MNNFSRQNITSPKNKLYKALRTRTLFWQVLFTLSLSNNNTFKSAFTLFLIRNQVTEKKIENYNPAHKMVEKFGKSFVLLIYLSRLSHVNDGIGAHRFARRRLPCSTLIICLIPTKCFCH